MRKATIFLATAVAVCIFALAAGAAVPDKARVTASYMKLPLSFIKNEGQEPFRPLL